MLERILGARSHIVICFTRSEIPSAHFNPIRPAPTIRTLASLFNAFSSSRASSSVIKEYLLFTVSRPSNGGTNGDEPFATQSESYGYSEPSSSVTILLSGSIFTAFLP